MTQLDVEEGPAGVRIRVWVKPRSSRSCVLGVRENALEVAVCAPPVDGAANEEVCQTLARFFGLAKTAVAVVIGRRGRSKTVSLSGIDVRSVRLAVAKQAG